LGKDDLPQENTKIAKKKSHSRVSVKKYDYFFGAASSHLFNPKGIVSFSPGLARFREGLPWVTDIDLRNPERIESQVFMKPIQPFQGCDFSGFSP
jgi:hypothetical protein